MGYGWWKWETASEASSSSVGALHGLFFFSFISSPLDEVLQLAFVLLVELGVEDFGDLIFGFAIHVEQRWRWLDAVRNSIWSWWFEDKDMEDWVDGL